MPVERPRPVISVPTLAAATGFPARRFPISTGAHVVAVVAVLLLGLAPVIKEAPPNPRRISQVELPQDPTEAKLLPELESSSASSSSPAAASAPSAPGRNAASSASSMLLIHQRRQHIISNTPDATNSVQTILQPDIEHPARLTATLPIPSMVRMAPPQHAPSLSAPKLSAIVMPAAPPAPAPVPQPTIPKVQRATLDTVPLTSATQLADSPKLSAYATTGRSYDPPKPPPPPAPAAAKPAAPAVAISSSPSPPSAAKPGSGTDARNLLVVNAFDVQSKLSESEIPAAEIHGRFEVTTSPSLPDGPTTGGSSSTAGIANSGSASSGNGAGKGNATSNSASGAGTAGGHGKGSGGGSANVAGAGSGHGAGLGTGAGSGTGHGSADMGNGSGTGGSGGNGASPFSGMTIVGGSTSGNSLRPAPGDNASIDVKNPHGYGMTIMSSGRSGGAQADYGVFTDGPVYTVYLDLSKLGLHGARWSLQYGASREVRFAHPGVPLTPPFPEDPRLPQLPPAIVAANLGHVVVVQANLKADGRLDALRVVQSPDQRLNEGLVTCLLHWYFEPAAMGSDKVPVKVLLGIPIELPMAADPSSLSQQAETGQRTTAQ